MREIILFLWCMGIFTTEDDPYAIVWLDDASRMNVENLQRPQQI